MVRTVHLFQEFRAHQIHPGLMRTLFCRIRIITSPEFVNDDLETLKTFIVEILRLIEEYNKPMIEKVKRPTTERNRIYLDLQFKDDGVTTLTHQRKSTAIERVYPMLFERTQKCQRPQ